MKRAVTIANILVAVALLVTYLAPWISPHNHPLWGFLAIGYLPEVLVNLIFGLFWMARRDRRAALSGLALLPGLVVLPSYFGLHPFSSASASSFKMMSCNANYFDSLELPDQVSQQGRVEELAVFFRQEKPDLLCGQDFTADGKLDGTVFKALQEDCGLSYSYRDGFSQAVFSRYPILEQHAVCFPDSFNSYLWVDVELPPPGKRLRIFNLHLQSYALRSLRSPWAVGVRLRDGLQQRSLQAEMVAQTVASSPYPVLVCGDFNDVPLSYAYHTISRGLGDGFRASGRGWGFSYAGPIPFLRIDYILGSPELCLERYRIPHPGFSDHYPAICNLSW